VYDGRLQLSRTVVTAVVALVTFVLGYLGWVLPSPGRSVIIPTLIVAGIGCAVGLMFWIITGDGTGTIALVAVAAVASVWTWSFSLPASLTWASNATHQAQSALSRLASTSTGDHGQQCADIRTGQLGPMRAPYRQCAGFTMSGDYVVFTAAGQTTRGLAYTDRGGATFEDECSRHLVGKWWMFTAETSQTSGDCPIGYQFHGGG
jgi:hypothetical protein